METQASCPQSPGPAIHCYWCRGRQTYPRLAEALASCCKPASCLLPPSLSRALWGLQSLFGSIPNVFGQGRSVQKLLKLESLYSQTYGRPRATAPEIGHLIVLDRDVDWTSCLLSPLTYEGLLDETFGISCGTVTFPLPFSVCSLLCSFLSVCSLIFDFRSFLFSLCSMLYALLGCFQNGA